nr:nck-associated protein 5-like [Lytechinus pictus]
MKETTMRELMQEREARSSLEKQLEGAVAENKSCNAQLEALQEEIIRLRSASSVNSLCDNAESCKRLQNGLSSTDTGLSDVERENCNVVVSNKQLELKVVSKEEVVKEKSALLERLRQLESENSALVLENENQRDTYDQCLDEVCYNQLIFVPITQLKSCIALWCNEVEDFVISFSGKTTSIGIIVHKEPLNTHSELSLSQIFIC